MKSVAFENGTGSVFEDIGFTPHEAAELTAKAKLMMAIKSVMQDRNLTQIEAARLCVTDQPTLSKVLRGRLESVTIDRLAAWLTALGQDVQIIVKPGPRSRRRGRLSVVKAA
jgi:predicted XRE-type DNA-binding protein